MSFPVDQRGKLEADPFDYQVTNEGLLLLYWYNKLVKRLAGAEAAKWIAKLEAAEEEGEHTVQLVLARATGHFKHGNER